MFKKLNFFLIFILLTSCGDTMKSIKRGLTGQKKVSTDEFLVKKKEPLVLPPKFEQLPTPEESNVVILKKEEQEIQNILSIKTDSTENNSAPSSNGSVEENILRKIKKN